MALLPAKELRSVGAYVGHSLRWCMQCILIDAHLSDGINWWCMMCSHWVNWGQYMHSSLSTHSSSLPLPCTSLSTPYSYGENTHARMEQAVTLHYFNVCVCTLCVCVCVCVCVYVCVYICAKNLRSARMIQWLRGKWLSPELEVVSLFVPYP